MRPPVDSAKILRFIDALGRECERETTLYLTGGACALLYGWRDSTIDIDMKLIPESDRMYRAIPNLKESLSINVELASPPDFIPELPGWEGRSLFFRQSGKLTTRHFDFYSQALSKVERGHEQDARDVKEMLSRGLIEPAKLRELFDRIEPNLFRYPAIDPPAFRRAVERVLENRDAPPSR